MDKDYIVGQELAKKIVAEDKEKALTMRTVLINARIAQRMEGVAQDNDFWLKEGFLDGTKEI